MSSRAMSIAGCPAPVLGVFDSLGYGGFLLDHERQVLAHNGNAANVLGCGLTLREKRGAATDRASDRRLQSVIEAALMGQGPADATSVGVRRQFKLPLLLVILRLWGNGWVVANAVRLLLIACDPERSPVPSGPTLADMFGLTPPETGVVIGIAVGRQLTEIAADRGIKIETGRWYSKIVFSKTQHEGAGGTRGAADEAGGAGAVWALEDRTGEADRF
jgi:hypothetical protein